MTVNLTRIYTRLGDSGETHLGDMSRVPKTHGRIEAYGTVDELNAALGIALHQPGASLARLSPILRRVQNELFNLGSELATLPADLHPQQPVVQARHVTALEQEIDAWNEHLPSLKSFILPGGGFVAAYLHLARTVCRRAERSVVRLGREAEVPAPPSPTTSARASPPSWAPTCWSASPTPR